MRKLDARRMFVLMADTNRNLNLVTGVCWLIRVFFFWSIRGLKMSDTEEIGDLKKNSVVVAFSTKRQLLWF